MGERRPPASRVAAYLAPLALLLGLLALAPASGAAAGDPTLAPGAGVAHPRVLFAPGDEDLLRERLTREPYRTVFLQMHARAESFNQRPLGDDSLNVHRDLSRAAKILAFEYALDRTVIGGSIVAFPDADARQAVGDRIRDLLLNLYPRSRLAVAPPIGGWDRDISTSEEIVGYATAFDLLLGGGYDLGADRAVIVERLASVTAELYLNFVDPGSVGGLTDLHQNNHRSKSGAAMAVAAVVLADDVVQARDWFDYGVTQVDDVLRHMLMTGDGAYAEGPFYYRFTMQNLSAFMSTWERVLGDASWSVGGVEIEPFLRHPQFRRTQRWMLDTTVPDGSMAPIDDGNPGRSYYFGVVPSALPESSAAYWRWGSTPQPYETDGNIEMGPDVIVAYDDTIAPSPPTWAPTQFYVEGGTASLRSDWSADGVMALVLGEHDVASEFGRDRAGNARAPQSHEHPDGSSFMLYAYGERLALDPGYLTFGTHDLVNKPQHHNMVLVDGQGPPDYLAASFQWLSDPTGRPPAEGQSTLHATLDGAGLDAASVATWYRDTEVTRRFLLADDRYLVVGDTISGSGSSLTWMQHGNGGGSSGGSYTDTTDGARWAIGGARLDSAIAVADQSPTLSSAEFVHEVPYTQQRTHTARQATIAGGSADAVQVFYPSRAGDPAPALTRWADASQAGIDVVDVAGDRRVAVSNGSGEDDLTVVDQHLDGSLRLAYAEGATSLTHPGSPLVTTDAPGTLGMRMGDGTVDVVAETADRVVEVANLGFVPRTVDGACSFSVQGAVTRVRLGRERRFTLRADGQGSRPAADAGGFARVAAGSTVALDGSRSCDADGGALTPRWELVSAPGGSSWTLQGSGSFHPELVADRPGPYRVRLIVTDESGNESLEREVVVIAGDRCGDGVDNDVDGRIDTDDPDCDGEDQPEVEPPDHAVADAPLDVVAAGGPRQVAVDWSPPADDGGTPITAYRVVDEAGTVVVTTAAEVTQAAIVGVPAGPSPRYRVVAVNAEGDSLPSPLTTVVAVDSAPVVFPDVGEGHPFFAEITWGVVAGLLRGRSDGTFAPASPVDRASWAAFLHRLAGSPSGPFADPGFADVGAGHPFFAEIAWAVSTGVMHGYGDATFRPTTTLDRAASVAVLHRLAGSPSGPFADPGFADVGAGHPFFAEIAWAVSTGVMHGYGDGLFRPASALSRQASVAAMLRSTREFDALG